MEPEQPPRASHPVVAVVVCRDPLDGRFDALLRALGDQDHPHLRVQVIDAASTDDPSERIRRTLPEAGVHRLARDPGFSEAANLGAALAAVAQPEAEFLVFCHDDVAPDPGAVRALVDAAAQWDADVVGPKLVDWDDPHRLGQVGLAVDRVGTTLPFVEPGELDQGQHDGVREVFAVPSGFTLVRAARFAAFGGFDGAVPLLGDDLALCWRARATGSRVLVTSEARVRHAAAVAPAVAPAEPGCELVDRALGRAGGGPGSGPPASLLTRLVARHRLRALLTCSGRLDLLRVVPQALVMTLVEAAGGVATGRPGRARATLGAWAWNLARPRSLWRARRRIRAAGRVPDRAVHRMQVRGMVGPRLQLRRLGNRRATRPVTGDLPPHAGPSTGATPAGASGATGEAVEGSAAWTPGTALAAAALVAVLLFGSRHLLTRSVPAVGELVPFGGSPGDLVREWARGWRSTGLGSETSAPTVVGVVGALGAVIGGHLALLRTVLSVGLLAVGIAGAYRLVRPAGSKPAQVAAGVAYAAVPLPYDGLAEGRWSAVAAYAAAPWILGRLARASAVPPFASKPAGRGPVAARPLWQHVVATGAVTGLAAVLVPQAPALLLLAGAALVVGTLLAFEVRGIGRVAVASLGGAVVAALLHLPTVIDLVRSRTAADAWLGLERPAGTLSALDLLRFDTGPVGIAPLGVALAGAAALPLLVGRGWRLGWAVRGWVTAIAAWAVVWVQQQGHLAVRLPDPGVVLAPGAAGLSLAVALGVAAIERDVRGRSWRFGFRRAMSGLGVLALVAATVPVVVASLDGRWDMPRGDFGGLLGFVAHDVVAAPSRVLWVGDPEVLPGGAGWELRGSLSYATARAATPDLTGLWPATGVGPTGRVGRTLGLAVDHQTSRLGRLLGPLGVQYVAVPAALAPATAADSAGDAPGASARSTAARRDLVGALDEQLDLQEVPVDDALTLYRNVAFAPGRPTRDPALAIDAAERYRTPLTHHVLLGLQVALWLAVVAVVLRMRPGHGTAATPRSQRGRSEPAGGAPEPEAAPGEPAGTERGRAPVSVGADL